MSESEDAYEDLRAQYQLVYVSYEEALNELLALAAAPEYDSERYQAASARVGELSAKLKAVREAMMLMHGRRGGMLPEPPMPLPEPAM